jgi:hypothetical protein
MNLSTVRHATLACLAAAVLSGCGGGGDGAPPPKAGPPPEPPADAAKLFQKPKKPPSVKGSFHETRPPAWSRTGPSHV